MTDLAALPLDDPDRLFDAIRSRLHPAEGPWTDLLANPQVTVAIRASLTARLMETQQILAARADELRVMEQQCFAMGPEGKARWFAAKGEHAKWRAGMMRFRGLVERRLVEVKAAQSRHNVHASVDRAVVDNGKHRDALRQLAQAVWAHRTNLLAEADGEPEPEDVRLWQVLDDIAIPYQGGESNLSYLVQHVWSEECDR